MPNVTPAWFAAAVSRRCGWAAGLTHDQFLAAGQQAAVAVLLEKRPEFRPLFQADISTGADGELVLSHLPARPSSSSVAGWFRPLAVELADTLGATCTVSGDDAKPETIRIELRVVGRLPQPERPIGTRVREVEQAQVTEKARLDAVTADVGVLKSK